MRSNELGQLFNGYVIVVLFQFLFFHSSHYRPHRSCEGYVFTGVCLSMGGAWSWGGSAPRGVPGPGGVSGPGGLVPRGGSQDALRQTPQERWLLLRMVRILLECILVHLKFRIDSLCEVNVNKTICISKNISTNMEN